MKKNLLFTAFILFATFTYSQQNFTAVRTKNFNGIGQRSSPGAGACDTANLQTAINEWSPYLYSYGSSGYVFGTSDLSSSGITIQQDANFFDQSASSNNYISGGLAFFAFANSNVASHLDKNIVFKVYNNSGGVPGSLLGSVSVKLSQIHQDVLAGDLTEFWFPSPIALPASKTFYVSIDHSAFTWGGGTRDSIAIVANDDDESTNAAYQYLHTTSQGDGWISVHDFWTNGGNPLDVNLFVFPYLSNGLDGCTPLPVTMLNFAAAIKNNDAYLTWSTATESNNKGFEIERSKDGQNFSAIGFVKGAGNTHQITNYNYTDATLQQLGVSKAYYRLKQIDLDGKATYSQVLPLTAGDLHFWKLYPNPVKEQLTVELSLAQSSRVTLQVISQDGRVVANIDKGILTPGTQLISWYAKNLASGSYLVRLTAGDDVYTQKFIKR